VAPGLFVSKEMGGEECVTLPGLAPVDGDNMVLIWWAVVLFLPGLVTWCCCIVLLCCSCGVDVCQGSCE
jgi:hypothetical protein